MRVRMWVSGLGRMGFVWFLLAYGHPSQPVYAGTISKPVRYEGTALDEKRVPIDGIHTLTFLGYTTDTQSKPLWREKHSHVQIDKGQFHVLLGQSTPLPLSWQRPFWLTLQVGRQPLKLSPRQCLTSLPLAVMAGELTHKEFASIPNWLINDSFEDWPAGPKTLPDGWTLDMGPGSIVMETEPEHVKVGKKSLKVTSTGNHNIRQQIQGEARDWLAGEPVTFGCWVKTNIPGIADILLLDGEGVGFGIQNAYRLLDTSGTEFSMQPAHRHSGSGEFEFLVTSGVVPETTSEIQVVVRVFGSGTAYFDGAFLAVAAEPFTVSLDAKEE